MNQKFKYFLIGVAVSVSVPLLAQTPTIFNNIRVNQTTDLRGDVVNVTGDLTLNDNVIIPGVNADFDASTGVIDFNPATSFIMQTDTAQWDATSGTDWTGDLTFAGSGKLTTLASAMGGAGLNLPHGTAPSAPVNGDLWTTTTGLFARINGSTVGPYSTGTSGAALSRVDDTNVTLTLGGSPSTALVNAASITVGWTGTLAASRGGLGMSTVTDDTIAVANGSAWVSTAVPNCTDTGGNHLNYTAASNAFSCGTSGSGGTPGGADTQVQYNNAGAFGGSSAFTWNDSTHSLLFGTQPTAPTIGTITSATTGTNMTIAVGDCSGASCSAGNLTIRGGQGTASSSTHGGFVTVQGGNADTGNRDGGAVNVLGGTATGLNQGGSISITAGAGNGATGAGGNATISAGTGSIVGNTVLKTGATTRITLTGTNSASTGVKFNGYGAGLVASDSSGNLTSTTTFTSGTFVVTFDDACSTSPTVTFNYQVVGSVVTVAPASTSGFGCTGDSINFASTGADVPAALRPSSTAVVSSPLNGVAVNNTTESPAFEILINSSGTMQLLHCGAASATDFTCLTNTWTAGGTRNFVISSLRPQFAYYKH